MKFELLNKFKNARRGRLFLNHGEIDTPAFMPVGTNASVKALSSDEIIQTGSQMILCNAFHLMLRPTEEIIKNHGGLHYFMNWNLPILTDSGGFQVFSLSKIRKLTFLAQVR